VRNSLKGRPTTVNFKQNIGRVPISFPSPLYMTMDESKAPDHVIIAV